MTTGLDRGRADPRPCAVSFGRAVVLLLLSGLCAQTAATADEYRLLAGQPSLAAWRLPPVPAQDPAQVALGRKLFFEPGLSADGDMACATCHDPALGWSDGRKVAVGRGGKRLRRATPSILNAGYNALLMWDGRFDSLEAQASGPIENDDEMAADMEFALAFLAARQDYRDAFAAAFPGEAEPITDSSVRRAIAAFERTVVSRDTPFDRWIRGDAEAMSTRQVAGFAVFLDPERGKCVVCHAPPNFTDDGFHNIGLASFGEPDPDPGRYAERPVALMRGAFKTPSLRDVGSTAPYFHDGSAATLDDVIRHYVDGGVVKTNLSPNLKAARLSAREQRLLREFLLALSSPRPADPAPQGDTPLTEHPARRHAPASTEE